MLMRGLATLKNKLAYNKKRYLKFKSFIDAEKSKPCVDCKIEFGPWVMQFDHRKPEDKKYTIADLLNRMRSMKLIVEEISKCDVVCANCHAERTHRQRLNKEI